MTLMFQLFTMIVLSVLATIVICLFFDLTIYRDSENGLSYYAVLFSVMTIQIVASYFYIIKKSSVWYFPLREANEIAIFIVVLMASIFLFSTLNNLS